MRALLTSIVGIVLATASFAAPTGAADAPIAADAAAVDTAVADAPVVVDRVDCAALNTQIEQLTAADPDDSRLKDLSATYRSQCMARSVAPRRTSGRRAAMPVAQPDLTDDAQLDVAADAAVDVPTAPVGNGPCPDGAAPNSFGCCAGERFTNMGNLMFACCPKSGEGECYSPLKVKKK